MLEIERYEFRNVKPEEKDEVAKIEQICFPPNEACSAKHMSERVDNAAELFLVAYDKENKRIAGFLNGLSTEETVFQDKFFTDITTYNPEGKNVMLLGLDVIPECRGQGLATEIVMQYRKREYAKGRKMLFLTCLESKVEMYKKMGFKDLGLSGSVWGGEQWHDMSIATCE